jgi:hypothetical protein
VFVAGGGGGAGEVGKGAGRAKQHVVWWCMLCSVLGSGLE